MIHPNDSAALYQTIDRHLAHSPQESALPLKPQQLPVTTAVPGAKDAPSEELSQQPRSVLVTNIAGTLYNLLGRYVALLESPDHGGWTLEEDEMVRAVVAILSQIEGCTTARRA
jgi:hypothetical protein